MTDGVRPTEFQLDHLSNGMRKVAFHIIFYLRVFLSVFHPVGRYRSIFFPLFYSNYFTYFYQGKSVIFFGNSFDIFYNFIFYRKLLFNPLITLFHLFLLLLFITYLFDLVYFLFHYFI